MPSKELALMRPAVAAASAPRSLSRTSGWAKTSRIDVRFWHLADILVALINVRYWGKADITATERNFNLRVPQKLRQLGDVRRDPPRLILVLL
jgi:hypothetical protein